MLARPTALSRAPVSGVIRCLGLDRVELGVGDLDRSRRFYRDIVGLQQDEAGAAGAASFRCGAAGGRLLLHTTERPGFRLAGWRLGSEHDLVALRTRLQASEIPFADVPATICRSRGIERAIRLTEPTTGALHEFHLPDPAADPGRFEPGHTDIQRLGHVVFALPEPESSIAFFVDLLDFRESDRIVGGTTFLRPSASPFHHGLGIGHATQACMHHLNFMVGSIDDIGRALHRMRAHGVDVVFGPGRHPVSGSVFLYFLDPDGLTLEYSFGMETFAEAGARRPTRWPAAPESVDTWGARRDPRLGAVGSIEPPDGTAHAGGPQAHDARR